MNEVPDMAREWYWIQPDADCPGSWAVCMDPKNAKYIVGRVSHKVANEICERLRYPEVLEPGSSEKAFAFIESIRPAQRS